MNSDNMPLNSCALAVDPARATFDLTSVDSSVDSSVDPASLACANGYKSHRARHEALQAKTIKDAAAAEPAPVTEMGLLQKATPFVELLKGRLPSHSELRVVVEKMGCDVATAVLSRAIHASPFHGAFASQVRAYDLTQIMSARAPMRQITRQFEVVLVASNLAESGRKWGDHVEVWRLWARQMGFTTDEIQTLPGNSISKNARVIAEHLSNRYHPHRIVVTFGQGASEFRFLLEKRLAERERELGALSTVRAWINICGSFGGSALHANINRSWHRSLGARIRLKLAGRQPLSLFESSSDYPLWRRKTNVPPETLVASLVGVTYGMQMAQGLSANYLELSKLGPNDGAILNLDAIAHPGLVVPIPGMTAKGESSLLEPMFRKLLLTTAEMMAPVLVPMGHAGPTEFSFSAQTQRGEFALDGAV